MIHHIEFVTRDGTGITSVVTALGVVSAGAVIDEIADGRSLYFVGAQADARTRVRVLTSRGGAYLFANWNGAKRNMLHEIALDIPRLPRPRTVPKHIAARMLQAMKSAFFRRASVQAGHSRPSRGVHGH